MLVLCEQTVVLDRVAQTSNFFHQVVGACEAEAESLRFLVVICKLLKVELVRSRVGVAIVEFPFVHVTLKHLENTATQVNHLSRYNKLLTIETCFRLRLQQSQERNSTDAPVRWL